MIKQLIVPALLLYAANSFAESTFETCDLIEEMAESVMTTRQNGGTMRGFLKIAEGIDDIKVKNLTIRIIENAFEKTRWNTESSKTREIEDFKEYWYKSCYRSLKK